jgi:hypothetical protein
METKKIIITDRALFVIGMFFDTFSERADKEIAWNQEDYEAYLSIKEYLKDNQYINEQ